MNLGTAVVLVIVLALVGFALRATFKKKGSCGCDCEGCDSASGGACSSCESCSGCTSLNVDEFLKQK